MARPCTVLARSCVATLALLLLVSCSDSGSQAELARANEALERLESRLASLESRLEKSEQEAQEGRALGERLDELAKKLEKTEEDMLDLHDDAIDRMMRMQETLGTQISRVLQERAEKKMQEMATRDLGELKRMLDEGGIELDEAGRRVLAKGSICQTQGLIEFLAVGEGGRDHESLLYVDCAPSLLNAALLSIGLEAGRPFEITDKVEGAAPGGLEYGTPEEPLLYYPPKGPRVHVYVEWKAGEKTVRHRAEDLLIDRETGKPMTPEGWVYLGSRFAVDEQTGKDIYVADATRDLISIWHSYQGNSILDNPHPGGMRDDTYVPRTDVLPERGTPITLLFTLEPLEG